MLKSGSNCESQFLGLIDFEKALELQNELVEISKTKQTQFILGLEHLTVMTLGLRAHNADLSTICSQAWNHPVHKISRGGLATIHNPGQLVIYPIVNLKDNGYSVKSFVQKLFLTTQKTLSDFGIESKIDLCQPGVYTDRGKIAFCGLQIKNGITMHGLSINVCNDISVFNQIQSCGVNQPLIDSVVGNHVSVSTREFYSHWLRQFYLSCQS